MTWAEFWANFSQTHLVTLNACAVPVKTQHRPELVFGRRVFQDVPGHVGASAEKAGHEGGAPVFVGRVGHSVGQLGPVKQRVEVLRSMLFLKNQTRTLTVHFKLTTAL
jgi:hypothetical protein